MLSCLVFCCVLLCCGLCCFGLVWFRWFALAWLGVVLWFACLVVFLCFVGWGCSVCFVLFVGWFVCFVCLLCCVLCCLILCIFPHEKLRARGLQVPARSITGDDPWGFVVKILSPLMTSPRPWQTTHGFSVSRPGFTHQPATHPPKQASMQATNTPSNQPTNQQTNQPELSSNLKLFVESWGIFLGVAPLPTSLPPSPTPSPSLPPASGFGVRDDGLEGLAWQEHIGHQGRTSDTQVQAEDERHPDAKRKDIQRQLRCSKTPR